MFATFTGIFQGVAGDSRTPVLMLSPIGYEELCGRAFFARLADALAVHGIPSLRFDYPGTADALDLDAAGLDDWQAAASEAADRLRTLTGHTSVCLLGQSLGALLALEWCATLGPVSASVLLEPPASGRAYLRGLKAWGAVIAASIGLAPDRADADGLTVAGMTVPAAREVAIRKLDPVRLRLAPAGPTLLLTRPGGATLLKPLLERLASQATEVTHRDVADFDAVLTDPTSAIIPEATIGEIATWLSTREPVRASKPRLPSTHQITGCLQGDGFIEHPVRFGPGNRLAGVVCEPSGMDRPSRAVVFANAGRDYHIGWGRSTVRQARALAQAGVASLRFDISGVGDSRPEDGQEGEVLYSARQCADLRAAIDATAAIGVETVGLVGRCSGGWAAFTVALDDPRVDAVALLNVGYFIWDPSKKLADVVRFSQRTVSDLGATFLKRGGFRRLLAGDLDVRGAIRFLQRQFNLRFVRPYAFLLGRLTPESRRYRDLHRLFTTLETRGVRTRLIYSERDGSLGELRSFMGPDLRRMPRYRMVSMCEIAGADHNFTRVVVRDRVQEELVDLFGDPAERAMASTRSQPVPALDAVA